METAAATVSNPAEVERRMSLQKTGNQLDELELYLETKQADCYRKHDNLMELDENLEVLRQQLEEKEKELEMRQKITELLSAGHSLRDIISKSKESEARVKKLTNDMYRVQEKLATAQYQIMSKDREILNLQLQIRKLKETEAKQAGAYQSHICTPTDGSGTFKTDKDGSLSKPEDSISKEGQRIPENRTDGKLAVIPERGSSGSVGRPMAVVRTTSLDSGGGKSRLRTGSVQVGMEGRRVVSGVGRRQTIAVGLLDVESLEVAGQIGGQNEAQMSKACSIQ